MVMNQDEADLSWVPLSRTLSPSLWPTLKSPKATKSASTACVLSGSPHQREPIVVAVVCDHGKKNRRLTGYHPTFWQGFSLQEIRLQTDNRLRPG